MKEQWREHVNFDEAENLLRFEKLKQQIETHFQKKSKKNYHMYYTGVFSLHCGSKNVLYWRFQFTLWF